MTRNLTLGCLAAVLISSAVFACGGVATKTTETNNVSTSERSGGSMVEANKAFLQKLFSEKKKLDDFPDRVDHDVIVHEPSSLPFGGTYRGLAELQQIYPKMAQFYDFSRFELLGVYGDGDVVFTSIKIGLAGSASSIYLAQKFTFRGTKVVEIRIYVCESDS
jgi:hypothetical protein